mgnify:CR=1 FL=1
MSVIKVNKIESTGTTAGGVEVDSSGHVQVDGVQMPTTGALSNRNLVINGGMTVSQRGTSFSFAHDGTTAAYNVDQMHFTLANLESFDCTVSQSTDAPAGFSNSWKLTTGTAETSIDANDLAYFQTVIEAQNLQQLNYGSSGAQTITLSFYVKSSVTGTFGCTVYQAAGVRNRTATYTINTANTWERKEITLTGDTAGTINNNNGIGFNVAWNLAAGSDWDATDSTSWGAYVASRWAYGHAQDGVITTAGATWQITGMQLEVGEKATPFEHRSYGDELARCQRYYQDGTYFQTDGNGPMTVHFIREMRTAPTMSVTASTAITSAAAGTAHYTGVSTGNTTTEFTIYNPGGSSVVGCLYIANAEL